MLNKCKEQQNGADQSHDIDVASKSFGNMATLK